MKRNILIKDYKPSLNLIDTEITIKLVKDTLLPFFIEFYK